MEAQANNDPQPEEEEFTEEQAAKFNEICKQAAELAQDYQRQSEQLKAEIVDMVKIYNKNQSPQQAVPVEQIVQITNQYQEGMREVQSEYTALSGQLKKEEQQRNEMMDQINLCFSKLQRMEKVLQQKQRKKLQQKAETQAQP